MKRILTLLPITAPSSMAQEMVFSGAPTLRIIETGVGRTATNLSSDQAAQYGCVIRSVGDRYYWRSRENKLLTRSVSGAYITFHATDGSGYVRIQDPAMKTVLARIGMEKFDYVEHLLLGLTSVTYYGREE